MGGNGFRTAPRKHGRTDALRNHHAELRTTGLQNVVKIKCVTEERRIKRSRQLRKPRMSGFHTGNFSSNTLPLTKVFNFFYQSLSPFFQKPSNPLSELVEFKKNTWFSCFFFLSFLVSSLKVAKNIFKTFIKSTSFRRRLPILLARLCSRSLGFLI